MTKTNQPVALDSDIMDSAGFEFFEESEELVDSYRGWQIVIYRSTDEQVTIHLSPDGGNKGWFRLIDSRTTEGILERVRALIDLATQEHED